MRKYEIFLILMFASQPAHAMLPTHTFTALNHLMTTSKGPVEAAFLSVNTKKSVQTWAKLLKQGEFQEFKNKINQYWITKLKHSSTSRDKLVSTLTSRITQIIDELPKDKFSPEDRASIQIFAAITGHILAIDNNLPYSSNWTHILPTRTSLQQQLDRHVTNECEQLFSQESSDGTFWYTTHPTLTHLELFKYASSQIKKACLSTALKAITALVDPGLDHIRLVRNYEHLAIYSQETGSHDLLRQLNTRLSTYGIPTDTKIHYEEVITKPLGQTSRLYLLYIDRFKAIRGGPGIFESEKGYKQGMDNSFEFLEQSIGEQLTLDTINALHDVATRGVTNEDNRPFNKHGAYPTFYWGYPLVKEDITPTARQEWNKHHLIYDSTMRCRHEKNLRALECARENATSSAPDKNGGIGFISFLRPTDSPQMPVFSGFSKLSSQDYATRGGKLFNYVFGNYTKEIRKVRTNVQENTYSDENIHDLLNAIATLCRALEVAHYFHDGNQRTVVFLLLNRLLIENGLLPVILDDPFVFNGYLSVNELVTEIKWGMVRYLQMVGQLPNLTGEWIDEQCKDEQANIYCENRR